jgi:hypothetical protein
VPRLNPTELQQARRASGNLGGRPRKPTVSEARAAALDELVPAAVKSLKAHLGDGDPNAWRAALRVFEQAFGRPVDAGEEDVEPVDPLGVAQMTSEQRNRLLSRVLDDHPELAVLVPKHAQYTPTPLEIAARE